MAYHFHKEDDEELVEVDFTPDPPSVHCIVREMDVYERYELFEALPLLMEKLVVIAWKIHMTNWVLSWEEVNDFVLWVKSKTYPTMWFVQLWMEREKTLPLEEFLTNCIRTLPMDSILDFIVVCAERLA